MANITRYIPRAAPKQTEIVNELRRNITRGLYPPGSRLPSITEMIRTFETSNVTIQRAMGHLRKLGYVKIIKREGYFVTENPPHLCRFGLVLPDTQRQFFKALAAEAFVINGRSAEDCLDRYVDVYDGQEGANPNDTYNRLVVDAQAHVLAGIIFVDSADRFAGTPAMEEPSIPRIGIAERDQPGITAVRMDDHIEQAMGASSG